MDAEISVSLKTMPRWKKNELVRPMLRAIKKTFENPAIAAEYEEWLKTYRAERAAKEVPHES